MKKKLLMFAIALFMFIPFINVHAADYEIGAYTYTGDASQGTVKISGQSEGVSSVGNFTPGELVVLEAFPKTGYRFKEWEIRNNIGAVIGTSTDNAKHLFAPADNVYYYAKFIEYTPEFINKIEINYENGVAFTNFVTGNTAIKSVTYTTPSTANYGKSSNWKNNMWIAQCSSSSTCTPAQAVVAGDEKLVVGMYTYLSLPIHANPLYTTLSDSESLYDFDKNNLNSIEVWINGVKRTDAVVSHYNSATRGVQVNIPITVTTGTSKKTVTYDFNGGTPKSWLESNFEVNAGDKILFNSVFSNLYSGVTPPDGKEFDHMEIKGLPFGAGEYTVYDNTTIKIIWKNISSESTYTIESGDESFTLGETNDIVITASGDLAKLTGIKVDGTTLTSSNYTIASGSTILTLLNSYLNTLSVGNHTITFVYDDGSVDATLKVLAAQNTSGDDTNPTGENTNTNTNTGTETNNNSNDNTTNNTNTTGATNDSNNPQTGDNVMFYISLLGLSIIGLAGAGLYIRKRRFN